MPLTPSEESKKAFSLESIFDVLYLIILLGLIIYGGYVFLVDRQNYTQQELILESYYFVPAFLFALVGIMTVRSNRSLIYALSALVIGFLLVIFFYQAIWPVIIG